jgi:ADP-ribose pyrophosphatase
VGAVKPRKWKTLETEIVYRTPIFNLHRKRASHPKRGERDFYLLEAVDWVNIIPLTRDKKVVMIRQWRHGIGDFTLEVPGGMVDATDESPMHAARREMIEETGFDSHRVIEIGKVHPNPAIQGNYCYSYLATGVQPVEQPHFDGSAEETEVVMVPTGEIRKMIATGHITHALTVAGFAFFHAYQPPGLGSAISNRTRRVDLKLRGK